ncbi:MAG: RNA 2',3'-cyclic phosphodiesterase [Acidobacteriota bacterium]
MRLFLAVDLDDRLRLSASQAAVRLRRMVEQKGCRPRAVKWVEARNLHVTLQFLGEVAGDRVAELLDVLSPSLATPCFDIGLDRPGVFPPQGSPRVIWMGITPGAPALHAVHAELADRLAAARLAVEGRLFQAHVTLARVREPIRVDLRALVADVAPDSVGVSRVEFVTLYRSHLRPEGPTYELQLRIPLRRT